jgi:glycosyltransferase involved in cell wall biosynthesis
MNIVHVVEPFAGGIVAFLKSLVEDSSGDNHIIIHGERAHVVKVADAKKQLKSPRVKYIHWKSAQRSIHPVKDLKASIELYRILKRLKKQGLIDAVHMHSSKSGFIGRMVCQLLGIRNVIYTPNGAPFLVGQSAFSNYAYKKLEWFGSLFNGKVVCCSESEHQAYLEAGIKALLINNGVPVNAEYIPDEASQQALVNRQRKLRIVTSGRILDQKDPALFNYIATRLEDHTDIEFIWIGYGPDASLITAKNFHITGWLTPEEARNKVATGDVYMSTARFEGLPFAVLEALSLRKPVLLSNRVGNRDMIDHGMNGHLFDSAEEAIERILGYNNNREMLAAMGKHSGDYCYEAFNIDRTRKLYRQLYAGSKQ